MVKKGLDKTIFKLLEEAPNPISTREIAQKIGLSWHTADRYCLKLQVQGKVSCFTIGKSTAWLVKKEDKK